MGEPACREIVYFLTDETARSLKIEFSTDGIVARALSHFMPLLTKTDLHHIVLRDVGLGDESVLLLCELLKKNNEIRTIDLEGNNISAVGAKSLAEALRSNTSLRHLLLSDNNIGDEGVKALSSSLLVHYRLTSLSLSANAIGPDGCKAFLNALKESRDAPDSDRPRDFPVIDLSFNPIGDTGISVLAALCEKNPSIRKLRLSSTDLTDSGCAMLALAVQSKNCQLLDLNLSQNQMTKKGVGSIFAGLKMKEGQRPLRVDLSLNPDLGPDVMKVLYKSGVEFAIPSLEVQCLAPEEDAAK